MTNQELFDIAYRGLAGQGFRKSATVNYEGVECCRLRGPNGMKCAIGFAVSDAEYTKEMETMAPNKVVNCSIGFGFSLQSAHDLSDSPADMNRRLHQLAYDYGLTIPSVSP